jgi:hypothetical protein
LLLNYTLSSATVAAAKFTKDGVYLGVGFTNGAIHLISGRPTFNSTSMLNFTTGKTISDIDFNKDSNKMLVCYSNAARFDIYHNYTGSGPQSTTQTPVANNIIHCAFS